MSKTWLQNFCDMYIALQCTGQCPVDIVKIREKCGSQINFKLELCWIKFKIQNGHRGSEARSSRTSPIYA